MNNREQEMIRRYLSDFEKHLPPNQREELLQEIEGLILEMVEDESVESVLDTLGDPQLLAREYTGAPSALISGPYYLAFRKYLPTVLISGALVFIALQVFKLLARVLTDNPTAFSELPGILSLLITAFGVFVIVLALLERKNVALGKWSPAQLLSEAYDPKFISRTHSLLGFAFAAAGILFLLFTPRVLVMLQPYEGSADIPAMIESSWPQWISLWPYAAGIIAILFAELLVRLVHPRWDRVTFFANVLANLASLGVLTALTLHVSQWTGMGRFYYPLLLLAAIAFFYLLDTWSVYKKAFR